MAFLSSFDIAGSGMTAQRKRMDVITENIVNRETLRTNDGGPYRRKLTVFQEIPHQQDFKNAMRRAGSANARGTAKGGVKVIEVFEDQSDLIPVYDPNHPEADEEGYVWMPNVDTTVEMIDAMAATRSYNANISAFEAIKNMATKALQMGK